MTKRWVPLWQKKEKRGPPSPPELIKAWISRQAVQPRDEIMVRLFLRHTHIGKGTGRCAKKKNLYIAVGAIVSAFHTGLINQAPIDGTS